MSRDPDPYGRGRGRGPGRTRPLRELRGACARFPGPDPSPAGRWEKLRPEWVSLRLGARSTSHALFVQRGN